MYRLKDPSKTPPKGFRFIDPETQFLVSARNHANWISQATDHRVANNLPLVSIEEMENQLCGAYDEKIRRDVCQECDVMGDVQRLGVGGTLKQMLASVGISSCWSCTNLAARMDVWGTDGCEEHMTEIVEMMNENAAQRKWTKYIPFKELGAEAIVRIAIRKVRNQD